MFKVAYSFQCDCVQGVLVLMKTPLILRTLRTVAEMSIKKVIRDSDRIGRQPDVLSKILEFFQYKFNLKIFENTFAVQTLFLQMHKFERFHRIFKLAPNQ